MAELNGDQWTLVGQLFERAAELPPVDRAAFLETECPDADVRQEVASLLRHSGGGLPTASAAIAAVAGAVALDKDPDHQLIGARLGPYKVEAIVGHGGMGAVYRAARDDAEYHQRVAIKLVRAAAASPSTLRRFRQERQILARLTHPNIARLLDGGSTPEGVPYLVMEFIEGESIIAWCERRALSIPERLRLFLPVCEAVEFAHKSLVVHRDLKPANILVTADGAPKLLDFGIAKLLDSSAEAEQVTLTGLQIMTPDYASPEQVRGDLVTPAADVYALGLILYEMLTGQKAQKITEYTPGPIAHVVCQTEPAAPVLLNPQLAGDLDNMIRMAIRKEPERRYASAGEMARDIQRHLDGLPVAARADSLTYRLSKLIRRKRVAAGVAVAAIVVEGLVLSLSARRGPEKLVPRVSQVTQLTQTGRVEVGGPVATDGARVYFAERAGGSWRLAQAPVEGGAPRPLPAAQSLIRPDVLDISPDRSSLLVAAGSEENEQSLWVVPTGGAAPRRLGNLSGHAGAWSRDGSRIVFAFGNSLYRVASDGTNSHKLLDTPGFADLIHWAPGSRPDVLRFHVVDHKKQSALWEVAADGRGLHRMLPEWNPGAEHHNERAGAWTHSGKYYFFLSWHGRDTTIWTMREERSLLPPFHTSPIELYSTSMDLDSLAVAPDDRRIFIGAGQERREFMRYDRRLRQFVPYLPGVAGRWAAYSKDGRWVVYVTYPEGALWRSRPDGSEAVQLTPPSLNVHQPRWSPDGSQIAFGGAQAGLPEMVYLIQAAGGAPQPLPAAAYVSGGASWSPDGKSLVFGCASFAGVPVKAGVYLMDLAERKVTFLEGSQELMQPVWSPDGRYIVAHRDRAQLLLFDLRTRQWTELGDGLGLGRPYWSHDGKYVYYQEEFGGPEQAISRVRVSNRKVERMMDLKHVPQSNVTAYFFGGLTPDDAPIVSVSRSNSDIYALDLKLP